VKYLLLMCSGVLLMFAGCQDAVVAPPAPDTSMAGERAEFALELDNLYDSQQKTYEQIEELRALILGEFNELHAAIQDIQIGPVVEPPPEPVSVDIPPQPQAPVPVSIPESRGDVEADQAPIDAATLNDALDVLRIVRGDVFLDMGCGDGRVLVRAIRAGASRAVGVEIDPDVAESARNLVNREGLSDRITILTMDGAEFDPQEHGISCGYCFLWPEQMTRLRPVLDQIPRLVTPYHELSWKRWSARIGRAHCYRAPPVRGAPDVNGISVQAGPVSVAVWKGSTYTSAKPGCNCQMCQSIRSQLAGQAQYTSSGRWVKVCVNGVCRMVWRSN
jgi:SAM-dependent methyltransferase